MKYWYMYENNSSRSLKLIEDVDQFPYKMDGIIYAFTCEYAGVPTPEYEIVYRNPIDIKKFNYVIVTGDCATRIIINGTYLLDEHTFKEYPQHYHKIWVIFKSKSEMLKWKLKV